MPKYNTDCRYYVNGICSKGNACAFIHDQAARNEYVCQFNMAGKCSFGQACRFKHSRPPESSTPSTSQSSPTHRPSTSSSSGGASSSVYFVPVASSTMPPRVRPVQLAQPGLNTEAPVFVPRWMEQEKKPKEQVPFRSYAAAAASAPCSSSSGANPNAPCSSSSTSAPPPPPNPNLQADTMLCPYYQKNGECNRKDDDCPFVHGDKCDMCMQWSLHPINEELRKEHQNECLELHSTEMERAFLHQQTESKTCGICMENIAEKNLRFGILNGCQHCFCLDCIRQWRKRDQQNVDLATKTVRSCPECRQHSDYVIPSLFWVEGGQEKDLLIEMYKENTKSKVCKYYSSKSGNCPFGNKCFYKHQLPDGSIDPGESPHVRRRARLVDYLFDDDDSDDEDVDSSDEVDSLMMMELEAQVGADFDDYLNELEAGGEFFESISNFIRTLHR
ncbi:hypothetical protein CAEBREN_04146 [Caenorhabditis brenneri]|uniref:RING-type E3 ubiquitin transferase n=1 Tax=Caenorhabditis brenneri TaxID=135651 RepID=G0NLU4_CAEBE|nr:hypothetical protein CAEBREN_04146 [Caenorhabditis brenneri]